MDIEVLETTDSVAQRAAEVIAQEARTAVAARGRFIIAVSGGHTPWLVLRALATADAPWPAVHVVQVDERVAPAGDPDRNVTHLRESLLEHAPLAGEVLNVANAGVAVTGLYQGRRRMTLTYPTINRSRRILRVVTGTEKAPMLARLLEGDDSVPAGRIRREQALVIAEAAAAAKPAAQRKGGA